MMNMICLIMQYKPCIAIERHGSYYYNTHMYVTCTIQYIYVVPHILRALLYCY